MSYVSTVNEFRPGTRGQYATDFSGLTPGCTFPNAEALGRNRVYRFNHKLFTGEYGENRKLLALIDDSYKEINYTVIPLNYFELMVNKLDSLLFCNEVTVKTGDISRDTVIQNLIDKTGWLNGVREAVKICNIYGDSCIKTYRHGISAFPPMNAYKVVDKANIKETLGYVLKEVIYDNFGDAINPRYEATHIRILVSCKGFEYERVYEYRGDDKVGILGNPVRYKYKDRWIPAKGRYYKTDVDTATVQWLSVNTQKDGLYGSSCFSSLKETVFALENRLSTENWVVDAHGKPLLVIGQNHVTTDECTGSYALNTLNGKYLIDKGGEPGNTKYVEWDGKLDASQKVREDLMDSFYELSEMGRSFLSGEYTGNVSEETLNNIIKSAIDRGERVVNDVWYELRKSLYVLCRLNHIEVDIGDINIEFNVGRLDDDKKISEVCKTLLECKMVSRQTLLGKYYGYNEEQAKAELELIKKDEEEEEQ